MLTKIAVQSGGGHTADIYPFQRLYQTQEIYLSVVLQ